MAIISYSYYACLLEKEEYVGRTAASQRASQKVVGITRGRPHGATCARVLGNEIRKRGSENYHP